MYREVESLLNELGGKEKLKRFTKKYYENLVYNEPLKQIDELKKITMGIDATLNYYESLECLSDSDIEIMERRVAEYELAVLKVLETTEKDNYTLFELRRLLEHIPIYYDKLECIEKKERALNSKIGYNF